MDYEFISEDQCSVCKDWPAVDKAARRQLVYEIPMRDVCVRCAVACWKNVGFGEPSELIFDTRMAEGNVNLYTAAIGIRTPMY
jgi:hypothetical protein